jgi:hypothetical protein
MRGAYYFRQHMYTLVPRQLRDDLAWMADVGTDAVCLAVLEQDLWAARSNLDAICREAERAGIAVHAVPSRWGGLVAGAPKVPSLFAANHPETWSRDAKDQPHLSSIWGPMASVHHPATMEFFHATLETLLTQWPVRGIIWDEPKNLYRMDFAPEARRKMPDGADMSWHIDAVADFFDAVGARAKGIRNDVTISMFLYAHLKGYCVERCARIETLDYFGCDGRPWRLEDRPASTESGRKVLLGQAHRFLDEARRNAKGGLILIENHAMDSRDFDLMDRRLPEVLALGAEKVLYYYYGRDVADPDRQMAILARHFKGNANA